MDLKKEMFKHSNRVKVMISGIRSVDNQWVESFEDSEIKVSKAIKIAEQYTKAQIAKGNQADLLVSMQKAEIEQQENFMKTLKDIYKANDMVEMQTLIEIYFENIDSCLLNKYKHKSDISLLSA